ncbi:unnamed protein product [Mytilus coruscus]|uniref:Uncharacterized protein n=1 Tax=Mytilus coruscus TaxID=42192 RepID=A0A6J8EJU7_MYTCO|nr:unnamed protein product [Mytilus coruscus]
MSKNVQDAGIVPGIHIYRTHCDFVSYIPTVTKIHIDARCLKNIIGIKWPNTICNTELWKRTKQEPIERTITRRRWKWIGHTLHNSNTNVARQALDWNTQCHRKRGLPKTTWHRDLTSGLQKIGKTWGEAKKLAKNRTRSKATVIALCPPWDQVD